MTFKNYLKLAFANFDKTWKLVLYRVVVWILVIGLIAPCYNVFKTILTDMWNNELFEAFAGAGLFYGVITTPVLASAWIYCYTFVTTLFTSYTGIAIYIVVVLFVIRPVLMNMGRYVIDEMMYGFMSSYAKLGFCSTFIRTLKKSIPYGFFRMLYCLPFNFAVLALSYAFLFAQTEALVYAMPFIFLVGATLIMTIKQVFILGWAPAMVVYGENVFKSFNLGIKAVSRSFKKAFLFAFSTYFATILFVLGFGPFSLVILVPLYEVVSSMFETMFFFACQGMRYYIDKDKVLSSKKLEEQDTMANAKFLL